MDTPLPSTALPDSGLLDRFAAIVGPHNVVTEPADQVRYVEEWRGYYHGVTPAVLKPGSVAEVAEILTLANATGTPVVPQGGNTGLVGGQIPDETNREIVLSLERLDRVRAIDPAGATVTVEAGVVLEHLHDVAAEVGMMFPLTLGSQGSCRIGGNISTNAGGVAVLAYGNTRNLVLGLEVVLPTGEVWNGLRSLVKDNTGYDLKQLFIGAEGTLGVVTAAVLKLAPQPRGTAVAFVGLASPADALALLRTMRAEAGQTLTGFELIPRVALEFLVRHMSGSHDPLAARHDWYVLVEVSSSRDEADARALAEGGLAAALEAGTIGDAAIAASVGQARTFWQMRHDLSEVQKYEGGSLKHDVSVPVQLVPDFIAEASAEVVAMIPGSRPVPFGHLGDGNIHFNISQPIGMDKASFMARAGEVHAAVHAIVASHGGSISAEHGIGRYKVELLKGVKSPLELDLMRRIKTAFDPNGILNPGRVLA